MVSVQREVLVDVSEGLGPTDGRQVWRQASVQSPGRDRMSVLHQEPADACQVMLLSTNH